jgi:membrane protease YdiL (CAAX protease family)
MKIPPRLLAGLKAILFIAIFTPILTHHFFWSDWSIPSFPRLVIIALGSSAFLLVERQPWCSIGICASKRFAMHFSIGCLIGTAASLSLAAILAACGCRWNFGSSKPALVMVFAFLSVATFEEIAFRGYIFFRLQKSIGPLAVVTFSTIFFASMHGIHGAISAVALPALSLAFASLAVSLTVIETSTIGTAIGLHYTWNLVLGSLLGFNLAGHPTTGFFSPVFKGSVLLTGGAFGPAAGLPGIAILGATFALIWVYRDRLKAKAQPSAT